MLSILGEMINVDESRIIGCIDHGDGCKVLMVDGFVDTADVTPKADRRTKFGALRIHLSKKDIEKLKSEANRT